MGCPDRVPGRRGCDGPGEPWEFLRSTKAFPAYALARAAGGRRHRPGRLQRRQRGLRRAFRAGLPSRHRRTLSGGSDDTR
jgi:hypothetical protein